jgi:hypothetical protein
VTRTAQLAALAIGCVAARAHAQQPLVSQPIDSGAPVRLHFSTGATRTGWLIAPFGPDSLVLRYRVPTRISEWRIDTPGMMSVWASDVRRLHVARGTRAAEGTLIGAAVGAGFAVVSYDRLGEFAGAVALVAGSAIVGVLVGSQQPRWVPAR